jgi:hypothetical protein
MLLDATTQRDFFANLGAHGRRELKLGEIRLDGDDARAGAHGTYVQHQNFALGELRYLPLALAALGANAEETTEEEKVDFEFGENLGELADFAEHLTDEAIGARERRVARRTDAD